MKKLLFAVLVFVSLGGTVLSEGPGPLPNCPIHFCNPSMCLCGGGGGK